MFSSSKKALPPPSNRVTQQMQVQGQGRDESSRTGGAISSKSGGILLGGDVRYNPESLPNGHIVLVGASGSGKTQTLKAMALELRRTYSDIRIVLIDFHGDQQLPGEKLYPLSMKSPHGINPLTVDLDPEGGGPALQAIAVAAILRKTLVMGPNQEGQLITHFKSCYLARGIEQNDSKTWTREPPNFRDLQELLEQLIASGDKDAEKLRTKLAAILEYGVFSRPQPSLSYPVVRFDLSALAKVPGLVGIAAESIGKQLLDTHRLMGEIKGKVPRTYLFIDEAKEMPSRPGSSCDRITEDGRKYGLALVVASQSERHLSANVIGNSATKIVLPVDQTDVKRVAAKFRFAEARIADLEPLEALVRLGKDGYHCRVVPYWQRL